jgi:hypothetical protein
VKRILLVLCLTAGACSGSAAISGPSLSEAQATEAELAAKGLQQGISRVHFVCGASDGQGVWAYEFQKGLQPDGMKDGRLVFVELRGGETDVIFKDATGTYISSSDDGGQVRKLTGDVWVITYPEQGIVETHNITRANGGKIIDLWTTNKSESVAGPSAKLFSAECWQR